MLSHATAELPELVTSPDCCLGPEWEFPLRTAGKDGQAFSVIRHSRRHYQKSPLRRCFKPRRPLRTDIAGFASGCRSRRRPVKDT
jgi:hypothetical protein